MIEKLKTALWFAQRPSHWAQAGELALRKFRSNYDGFDAQREASGWAAERAVPVADALSAIGLMVEIDTLPTIDQALLDEGEALAIRSAVTMGGPGDVNLLHAAVALTGATRIIETGVAYGWSSLSILAALEGRENVKLVSVDMPYPKMNNEAFVGLVVPEHLRGPWQIVHKPDRRGLEEAINLFGGEIDLCHYDSDKSWWDRHYAFPLLWAALVPGGIFISDDIQDNMAFANFVENRQLTFAVTEFDGKYIGISRKA